MQIFRKPELSKKKVIILSSVIILLVLFCIYQNKHLTVSKYAFSTDKAITSDSFRIVQISDLHNAKFGSNNERLTELIREQDPDIIVITGDIADSSHTDIDTAVSFCDEAVKIAEERAEERAEATKDTIWVNIRKMMKNLNLLCYGKP